MLLKKEKMDFWIEMHQLRPLREWGQNKHKIIWLAGRQETNFLRFLLSSQVWKKKTKNQFEIILDSLWWQTRGFWREEKKKEKAQIKALSANRVVKSLAFCIKLCNNQRSRTWDRTCYGTAIKLWRSAVLQRSRTHHQAVLLRWSPKTSLAV